jgi:hypothetical protein
MHFGRNFEVAIPAVGGYEGVWNLPDPTHHE